MLAKNTPILIVGFGSIGERHYRNLQSLGYSNVSVYDVDQKKISGPEIVCINNLDSETLAKFEVAFICNPTVEHILVATACATQGCHLFIEKPLSHNLERVDELIELVTRKKLIAMVACNFRFHDGFRKISELVSSGKWGKSLAARVVIGHDLSQSRPGTDYRETYAAKAKGGGVIL